MSLERGQSKAREHQQTGRSLSAWPVCSGGTRSHSLCQDPPYQTTTVAHRLVTRRPIKIAAITLANKIARIAWTTTCRACGVNEIASTSGVM
jgi:hypothetical protein